MLEEGRDQDACAVKLGLASLHFRLQDLSESTGLRIPQPLLPIEILHMEGFMPHLSFHENQEI